MALKQVGAAWTRPGKKGDWLSISLEVEALSSCVPQNERIGLLCFRSDKTNKKGEYNEKAPDYKIYTSVDEE